MIRSTADPRCISEQYVSFLCFRGCTRHPLEGDELTAIFLEGFMTVPRFKELLLNAPQIGPGVRPIDTLTKSLWTGERGFQDLKPNKSGNEEEGQLDKSTTSYKTTEHVCWRWLSAALKMLVVEKVYEKNILKMSAWLMPKGFFKTCFSRSVFVFSLATTSVASKIQVLLQQNLSSKNLQVMQNSTKK